jgi:hypothetical protein
MVHIPSTNPKYRSKKSICEDVAHVLNSKLAYGTKFAVVNQVNWVWTEYYGKYRGCPYWSLAALQHYEVTGKVAGLKHEHVVPKKVINEMIFKLEGHATPQDVWDIYNTYLIGVVVTAEEDKQLSKCHNHTMPSSFCDLNSPDNGDPWLRYKLCSIPVTYMRHAILKILPTNSLKQEIERERLMKNLYKYHWIDTDFDWPKWDEGTNITQEHIPGLDIPTIRKLFTAHFRQDRFCEGHLDALYANGFIAAMLNRLKAIIANNEDLVPQTAGN